MLSLRGYQERSLEALEKYLVDAAEHGAQKAFVLQTSRPYLPTPQMAGLPYVCIRVPTGGGKTLLAAHSIGITARRFIQADHPLCLWLVPSNTIREQTLAALRDLTHPYRQAVEAAMGGQVSIMDIGEALYVQRGTLDGETCIIVATLAAFRVEDTEGRKVYEESGALQHHFSGLESHQLAGLDQREGGGPIFSLANVLRLRRPMVIIDEAHNARTPLSFGTLARLNPSCVLEFTATPETVTRPDQERFASNVLHHVSAAELKAEEMIKLPIKLRTREDWKEVVADALQTQRELEAEAREEERLTGEYIRPIILFQAQARSQGRSTLDVETVKQALIDDFKIPEDHIAVATGQTREIEDIDLFQRSCPIRYIITVQALKEGWDCSFAYILCSLANTTSARAVEQLMGRVLRMPRAKRKQREPLNCSYAFAASREFAETANALRDALVDNGFERFEAETLIVPKDAQGSFYAPGSLFHKAVQTVSAPPDLSNLQPDLKGRVTYEPTSGKLEVVGALTYEQAETLKGCFKSVSDQKAVEFIYHKSQGHAVKAVPVTAQPFTVPLLAARVDGRLELFDESHFLDSPWDLAQCDATLSEGEFSAAPSGGSSGEVDVADTGKVQVHFVEQLHAQLSLLGAEPGWTVASLTNWLDRAIPHPDIPQSQSSIFIHKTITALIEQRGLALEKIARQKFRLRNAIERRIDANRQAQSRRAYQQFLFGKEAAQIEVSADLCLSFEERKYAPNWYYEGGYTFAKHYFPLIGELKEDGEEFRCAVHLDTMPEVKFWVRNLERRSESAFWLQTSTDKFYPDFVAMLTDGRILVVEYKGEDRWTNDDSKEKRALGELWADRSKGRCLFVMPRGPDWAAIRSALS